MERVGLTPLSLVLAACTTIPEHEAFPTVGRVLFASEAGTARAGTAELELGASYDPDDAADVSAQVNVGLTARTELFALWFPYAEIETGGVDDSGIGDAFVGVQHRFRQERNGRPALATRLTTKLPLADEPRGLGSGELDQLFAGIASGNRGHFRWTGYYELGLLGEARGSGVDVQHGVAVVGAGGLTEAVGVFAELAGVFVHERHDEQVFGTLGLECHAVPGRVFDVGVVAGISEDAPDFGFVLGMMTTTPSWSRPSTSSTTRCSTCNPACASSRSRRAGAQ